jgi:hypothetical protein
VGGQDAIAGSDRAGRDAVGVEGWQAALDRWQRATDACLAADAALGEARQQWDSTQRLPWWSRSLRRWFNRFRAVARMVELRTWHVSGTAMAREEWQKAVDRWLGAGRARVAAAAALEAAQAHRNSTGEELDRAWDGFAALERKRLEARPVTEAGG